MEWVTIATHDVGFTMWSLLWEGKYIPLLYQADTYFGTLYPVSHRLWLAGWWLVVEPILVNS